MSETEVSSVDINRIMQMIPHRYPFLLVDRVEDMVKHESATGIKNVTVNEPFFPGHFPQRPVMPGVLIVEAMAQTAAVLVVHSEGQNIEGRLVYFMSIDGCRFRKPVGPGDQLKIKVKKERQRGHIWKFDAKAYCEDNLMAEATITAMIVDE